MTLIGMLYIYFLFCVCLQLYGLYNDVIDTVHGYYDILWVEVDIEKINLELQDFQNRLAFTRILLAKLNWVLFPI